MRSHQIPPFAPGVHSVGMTILFFCQLPNTISPSVVLRMLYPIECHYYISDVVLPSAVTTPSVLSFRPQKRLPLFCHSDRRNDSARRSYVAEESELQLNSRLSNEETSDSSVRSWRPLSRNDNPLFYGICEIQRSHYHKNFQSIRIPNTENYVIAFPLWGKGG